MLITKLQAPSPVYDIGAGKRGTRSVAHYVEDVRNLTAVREQWDMRRVRPHTAPRGSFFPGACAQHASGCSPRLFGQRWALASSRCPEGQRSGDWPY